MTFAEVAVDIPGDRARTFTYSIPDGMTVEPGHAVRVPFGSRTRRGVVFALSETTDLDETRAVERLLDETPLVLPPQLKVARWLAGYYRVGLFQAASLMFPTGFSDTLRTYVAPADAQAASRDRLNSREQRALASAENAGRIRRERLARSLGRGGAEVVDRLVRRRLLHAQTVYERPQTGAVYRNVVRLASAAEDAPGIAAAQRSSQRSSQRSPQRSPNRAALIRFLAESPSGVPRPELVRQFGASAVTGVVRAGLAAVTRERVTRDPLEGRNFQRSFALDPTADQAAAISQITRALGEERRSGAAKFLLYGVTGSGKTEVYLQAAEACLSAGKSVVVLVPEIALTLQAVERYAGRFAGRIALLHSGLSSGERYDQWWAARRGEYDIVLGSRSAVFAPLRNVGLVVIDEEHEWTYKQHDASPRYHARAVAEKLCETTGAVLLAGSATPDVETFRRAGRGEYVLLRMPTRVGVELERGSGRTPAGQAGVQVVDMRDELRAGHSGLFSRALQQAIGEALNAGGRVILFLNRRGAGAFVQCRDCGHVRTCRRCDTALVHHSGDNRDEPARLTCHYCNYRVRYSGVCPNCSARGLRPLGAGTQRVVEEVERLYPNAGVLRWDRDTARTARAHAELLERFMDGTHRVMVGTQMVAKGLDIPAVTLVGVVSADTGLSIPDFRAGERAFQVLTQVAGRVGRGPKGGRAIIQTFQPDHYAVSAAAAQDFEAFYAVESELRRRFANPPFSRLIRLGYGDADAERARERARDFAESLRRERALSGEASTEVIGPSPSYPLRVRGLTRWHVLLKGAAPHRLLDRLPLPRGWAVDVDPVSVT